MTSVGGGTIAEYERAQEQNEFVRWYNSNEGMFLARLHQMNGSPDTKSPRLLIVWVHQCIPQQPLEFRTVRQGHSN